ncbi:glycosyltransferase [Photobacterium carnosum]|uniref:glycosyltransferase n=1 Tax=Photobacterium carnosum TaxID=2023717 RepID=UPI001E357FF1|nr:glycosyltransferase [Photobacterium carnosum]MCD9513349.1 glycosyltransferase [Photobacterium carnosum]
MSVLSIITVNYNDADGLYKTLNSIDKALSKYKSKYELYVIDGGSKDDSLNVIKEYENIINDYISEKDNGIYDAMNKGLSYVSGDFLLFLNSGDYFNIGANIDSLFNEIEYNKDMVIFWSAYIKSVHINWYFPPLNVDIKKWSGENLPNHQAMLFPKKFFISNQYDLNMKINSDADYKLRAIKMCGIYYIPFSFTSFEIGGLSSQKLTWSNYKIRLKDIYVFESKHNNGVMKYKHMMISFCKYTFKLIASNLLSDKLYIKILKK